MDKLKEKYLIDKINNLERVNSQMKSKSKDRQDLVSNQEKVSEQLMGKTTTL